MGFFIGLWIFIIGLCVGSFINVVVIRDLNGEQFVKGRSHCMSCNHELAWYDNIPLFSYISLRGNCRYCGKHISLQYPVVEAINGISWLLIFIVNGANITSIIYMLAISSLLTLSIFDLKTEEIPFIFTIIVGVLGLINMFIIGSYKDSIIGAFAVPAFLMLVAIITSGRGIGTGDIKLEVAIGILLGFKQAVLSFYAGCIILIIAYIILHKIKVRGFESNQVPFGPALSFGAFIMMLCGSGLVDIIMNWIKGV